jgi:DNA-binding NarL/FixJ family response regulator
MIRVVIADAHHIMRQGLRALLERTDDIQIIGEAEDGQQACELVERLAPDVIVMDLAMPRLNGREVVARLRARGITTQVVILSEHSDSVSVRQAVQSGVCGYLLKRSVAEELPLAIRAARRKEIYLTPSVTVPLLQGLIEEQTAHQVKTGFDALTLREREVFQLVAEGKTNRAIAHALHLSAKMVEQHRANLTAKLNVRDTAGLVRLAVQHGLVSLDE